MDCDLHRELRGEEPAASGGVPVGVRGGVGRGKGPEAEHKHLFNLLLNIYLFNNDNNIPIISGRYGAREAVASI